MAGDDANPAVPGYDPDISAELYTTNGDTDTHAHGRSTARSGFTPEMSHLRDRRRTPTPTTSGCAEDCVSGFIFPDDEELIQAEFDKNIPFALSVAQSAARSGRPGVGGRPRRTPDFVIDPFDVSYGTHPAGRRRPPSAPLKNVRLHYSVNGGATQTATVKEWKGGERYGDTNDDYYAEFRGKVTGTKPGDRSRSGSPAASRGTARVGQRALHLQGGRRTSAATC